MAKKQRELGKFRQVIEGMNILSADCQARKVPLVVNETIHKITVNLDGSEFPASRYMLLGRGWLVEEVNGFRVWSFERKSLKPAQVRRELEAA